MARRYREINVDAMLRKITAKQFLELEAFEAMDPAESKRDDYRAASIAATVANVNRGEKQAPYSYDDFIVRWIDPEEKEELSAQEYSQKRAAQIAIIRHIVAMNNAQPNIPEC